MNTITTYRQRWKLLFLLLTILLEPLSLHAGVNETHDAIDANSRFSQCTFTLPNCLSVENSTINLVTPNTQMRIEGQLCNDDVLGRDIDRNIVFLIDRSLSMEINDPTPDSGYSKRIIATLDAINLMTNKQFNRTKIGIVFFADTHYNNQHMPELIMPLTDIRNINRVSDFVRDQGREVSGGANYIWPLQQARAMLRGKLNPTIVILSDGAPFLQDRYVDSFGNMQASRYFCRNRFTGEERFLELGQGLSRDHDAAELGCRSFDDSNDIKQMTATSSNMINGLIPWYGQTAWHANTFALSQTWLHVDARNTALAFEQAKKDLDRLINEPWFKKTTVFSIALKTATTNLFEKPGTKSLLDKSFIDADGNARVLPDKAIAGLYDPSLLKNLASKSFKGHYFYIDKADKWIPIYTQISNTIIATKLTGATAYVNNTTHHGSISTNEKRFSFDRVVVRSGSNDLDIDFAVRDQNTDLDISAIGLKLNVTLSQEDNLFNKTLQCKSANHAEFLKSNDLRYRLQGGSSCAINGNTKNNRSPIVTTIKMLMLWLVMMVSFILRRRRRVLMFLGIATLLVLSLPQPAQAAPSNFGINVQTLTPVADGQVNLVIPSAELLRQGHVHLGVHSHYVNHPIQNGDGLGHRQDAIFENLMSTDLTMGYGIHKFFDFGLTIPMSLYQDAAVIVDRQALSKPGTFGMGDITLAAKGRLFDAIPTGTRGAIMPFYKIPTGHRFKLLGNATQSYGAFLLLDQDLPEGVRISLNVGALFRSDKNIIIDDRAAYAVSVRNQFLYGLGIDWLIPQVKRLQLAFNLKGAAAEMDGLIGRNEASPMEMFLGGNVVINPITTVTFGIARGIGIGIGAPNFRALIGLSVDLKVYTAPKKSHVFETMTHQLEDLDEEALEDLDAAEGKQL